MSEWISEDIWRRAIELQRSQLEDALRPGFILYHHNVLDEAYTKKYVEKIRGRIERIQAAGRPEWRERLNA